jgi:hypothetical protein
MGRQMRQKRRFFWLHPPPTSLEAYSLLYLYLYNYVDIFHIISISHSNLN